MVRLFFFFCPECLRYQEIEIVSPMSPTEKDYLDLGKDQTPWVFYFDQTEYVQILQNHRNTS